MAVVESLWVIAYSGEDPIEKKEVEMIAGRGVEGDRYSRQAGTYSALPEKGRQCTLISADSVKKATIGTGLRDLESVGSLRRNVAVRGLSAADLLDAIGREIQVGEVTLFVHRNCVPCMYNEKRNGVPGLMEALWDAGGVSCEVVRSGRVRVGDSVRVSTGAKDLSRVSHDKPPAFFVRPSQRPAEDVKAKYAGLAALRAELEAKDPEGARRLEAAHNAVGLRFFPVQRSKEEEPGFATAVCAVLPPILAVLGVYLLSRV